MSFLGNLFHKEKRAESVVLIDISAESVAGAYAHYVENDIPVVLYTRRLPIEIHDGEPHETAMLRALKTLGDELIREGAPILMRAAGSGSASVITVSIDTPWQETKVRTENFERTEPFTFTRSMVATAMQKTSATTPGKVLADESIIGTILNGYETSKPFGRKAHRASVIVLSSLIDEGLADGMHATLRGLFHTRNIRFIAGSSLRYQAMRIAFPHEHDALILDATGPSVSISLIKNNLFTALAEIANTADDRPWIGKVIGEFSALAENHPLPRTIFLLVRESELPSVQKTLAAGNLGNLWLSDNPPKIIPVLTSHIAGLVRQTTTTPPDLQLLLMALYCRNCTPKE